MGVRLSTVLLEPLRVLVTVSVWVPPESLSMGVRLTVLEDRSGVPLNLFVRPVAPLGNLNTPRIYSANIGAVAVRKSWVRQSVRTRPR